MPVKPARKLGAEPFGLTGGRCRRRPYGRTRPIPVRGWRGSVTLGKAGRSLSGTSPSKENVMPDCNRPDHLIVIADHIPGAHVTDSEDIFTGRGCIFDWCEFVSGGAR